MINEEKLDRKIARDRKIIDDQQEAFWKKERLYDKLKLWALALGFLAGAAMLLYYMYLSIQPEY